MTAISAVDVALWDIKAKALNTPLYNCSAAGSHAGVSIGEDGPSQMALEDLAMCRAQPNITVLYPCDGVSAERLVALAAYHPGAVYIRTSRPKRDCRLSTPGRRKNTCCTRPSSSSICA